MRVAGKILLSISVIIFWFGLSFAEIQKYSDRFSGKTIISSEIKKISYFDESQGMRRKFDSVTFVKRTDINSYTLNFVLTRARKALFKKANIKVDNAVHSLSLIGKSFSEAGVNRIKNQGYFKVPESVARKISRAKSLTLKIGFSNRGDIIWDVPSGVLSEWKKVLAK